LWLLACVLAVWLGCASASPKQRGPAPVAIHPAAEVLPANHLKFYLLFPEPMREGVFLTHCRLLDARGREVSDPFRETELWSADGRRLTLWLHPGRQKTGVNLNVEFGPVLVEGGQYTLRISGQWPTARGTPLGNDSVKTFAASAADRTQPALDRWRLLLPRARFRDPLLVQFDEPLDWALLHSKVRVERSDGTRVGGAIQIGRGERTWAFTPDEPWRAGDYQLTAEGVLEDLAGNSLLRPFEVDLSRALRPATPKPALFQIPFAVTP
jgi:hypothetical protein